MKQTIELLNVEDAQDPKIVANEIAKLIEIPQGQRPLRTIPGKIELGFLN